MFYPGIISRRKNWRIVRRLRPGNKSIALTLFALMLSALFSLSPGETKGISAASPKLHEKAVENLVPGQQPPPATTPSGWPYPRSDYSVSFNFSTVFSKGRGSDQWPMTWAENGDLYAPWGDGTGWAQSGTKYYIGVTKIRGNPPNLSGSDIWKQLKFGSGSNKNYKPLAIVAEDSTIYMFLDTKGDRWDGSYGAVSRDNGDSWSIGSNKVFSLSNDRVKVVGIAQFGPGYTNIPSGLDGSYFYVYLSGRTDGKEPTGKDVYLGRVKKADVFKRSAYQYFNGLDSSGNPVWSGNWSRKEPVFHDNNGMGYHVSVTYNPGIGRFIYTKGHKISHLGVFEGSKPWGPWRTVYYERFKDNLWKFTYMFPQKWISSDGKTMWMAWSGWPEYDKVSFIKATLSSESPDPSPPPTPTPTPTPPLPTPPVPSVLMIPGRLEAEDYKSGGEGVGYHDATSGNSGGEYRKDDVDIEVTTDAGGGYNVGWIDPGEWLEFDVEVAQTGNYDITARVASAVPGVKSFHLSVDGVDVTGPMSFTDASGWQSWRDVSLPNIPLSAGTHELRLEMDTDSLNVNYLEVTPSAATAMTLPGRLEAEAYKAGGAGVAYHDTTSGNSGGEFRADDVDIEVTTDAGGGYNVGWIDSGEWLAFDVEVTQTGSYDLIARVASAMPGAKSLHVSVDGVNVTGPMSFTDASGWQSWLDVMVPSISLSAGRHELRLVMDTDFLNVNYLEVVPTANQPPVAAILSPGEGASFLSVETIDFSGSATDFEDGDLSQGLVWTSSLDGALGTGESVQASLSAGDHSITLIATDSQGTSGSDTVTVNVVHLVYGDANGDGQFTGDDIYPVVDWVIGRQPMPQAETPAFVAADVDGDGSITAHDVRLMIDRLSGALDKFPVEP